MELKAYTCEGFALISHAGSQPICDANKILVNLSLRDPSAAAEMEADSQLRETIQNCMSLSKEKRKRSKDACEALLDDLQSRLTELATRWMDHAGRLRLLNYIEDILSVQYPSCTGNQWEDLPLDPDDIMAKCISNHAYSACIRISEDKWREARFKDFPYDVSYQVRVMKIPGVNASGVTVKNITRSHFPTKKDAMQYAEGRIAYLNKRYFSSLDPLIPASDRKYFLVHNMEIPIYHYEEAK